MLRGNYAGKTLGSGTDMFKFWDERRAGTIGKEEWQGIEGGIARSYGHCMTMGTASTMTVIAEAMGLSLPVHHQFLRLMPIISACQRNAVAALSRWCGTI